MAEPQSMDTETAVANVQDMGDTSAVAVANEQFDWQAHISNYTGYTRIPRLLHIAAKYPAARIPAADMAIELFKTTTCDTANYQMAVTVRNTYANGNLIPASQRIATDLEWVNSTVARMKSEGEKLDLELRQYQNNMIKESIRMAHRDLGDHHRRCGNYGDAITCYGRTRDYCSTSEHVMEMCMNVIEVSLDSNNYSNISVFVSKAEGVLETYNPDNANTGATIMPAARGGTSSGADAIGALFRAGGSSAASESAQQGARATIGQTAAEKSANLRHMREAAVIESKLQVANALASLGAGQYEKAARQFAKISPAHASAYSHMISPGDMAMYAVLGGLATLPRAQLKSVIMDSPNIRMFMESETHARDLLDAFWTCKFRKGYELLAANQMRYQCDLHLAVHLDRIVDHITTLSQQQFLQPFGSVAISRMAEAFGEPEGKVAKEVVSLIESKRVDARVSWRTGVIEARRHDKRSEVFSKTLESSEAKTKTTKKVLLRMSMVADGMIVRDPTREKGA